MGLEPDSGHSAALGALPCSGLMVRAAGSSFRQDDSQTDDPRRQWLGPYKSIPREYEDGGDCWLKDQRFCEQLRFGERCGD